MARMSDETRNTILDKVSQMRGILTVLFSDNPRREKELGPHVEARTRTVGDDIVYNGVKINFRNDKVTDAEANEIARQAEGMDLKPAWGRKSGPFAFLVFNVTEREARRQERTFTGKSGRNTARGIDPSGVYGKTPEEIRREEIRRKKNND